MKLYDKIKIRNTILLEYVNEWKQNEWISDTAFVETYQKLVPNYKKTIWSVRIGLFLLAAILVAAVFGLAALFLDAFSENALRILCLVFGMLGLASSIYFIREKEYFKNGIDHGLLYGNLFIFCVGITLLLTGNFNSSGAVSFIFFINFLIVLVGAFYTIDWLLVLVAFALLGASMLTILVEIPGAFFTAFFYFSIAVLFFCYEWVIPKIFEKSSIIYADSAAASRAALVAMITFGLNVFIQDTLLNEKASTQVLMPKIWNMLGVLFMFAWPVYVIWRHMIRRDILLVVMGLLSLVVAFLTMALYVWNWEYEWVLLASGILCLLLAAAGFLLSKNKPDTYSLEQTQNDFTKINQLISTMLMIQTATNSGVQPQQNKTEFGGGEFGGAGAQGDI
ncbi:MAG: hypothetical protein IPO27_06270 [Bacteroidetes bacterium]|nr:hypothetical protein [Bacteroidota bacterium]